MLNDLTLDMIVDHAAQSIARDLILQDTYPLLFFRIAAHNGIEIALVESHVADTTLTALCLRLSPDMSFLIY